MSYEVSIKRATGNPPLTADDFKRIVTEDSSLSGGEREPITWTDPTSGQTRYINVAPESSELSTDDTRGDEASICRFLAAAAGFALIDAIVGWRPSRD